jgi:antitoxin component YwqK of YwqJK toxin-antitoxin module
MPKRRNSFSLILFAILGMLLPARSSAQALIPFAFTSDDDNKLIKDDDTLKYYEATDDSVHIVCLNEEASYYKLQTRDHKVVAEGEYIADGDKFLQNGRWTAHYDNGKLHIEGAYSRGLPIGTWHEYYASGKPRKTYNFGVFISGDGAASCLSGTYEEYYTSGKLKISGYYQGEQSGKGDTVEIADPVSGQVTKKVLSRNNLKPEKTGTWEYFTETGELDRKENF